MSKAVKFVVDSVIHDLKHRPEDFWCDAYVLRDKKNHVEYWITNCFFDAGVYKPYKMSFGFIQGYRFHQGLDFWKAWYVAYGHILEKEELKHPKRSAHRNGNKHPMDAR